MFSGLILLLVVLGTMQYRWQTQISQNARERMQRVTRENASRFAEDFNKQIQNAYFNFQIGSNDWNAKNFRPFVERYDFWREKTKYPELISDFYFFDAAGKSAPARFDRATGTFVSTEWTPELQDVFARASNTKDFHPVNDDIYTLLLPEQDEPRKLRNIVLRRTPTEEPPPGELEKMEMPTTYGYLAIELDPAVIKERIFPDLVAQYFGDADFRLSITDRQNQPVFQTGDVSASDAEAPIFGLSPNDIFFFANRDLADKMGEKKEILTSSHVESRTMTRTEVSGQSRGTVKIEVQGSDDPGAARIFSSRVEDPVSRWTLSAQHNSGSIDAFIGNAKFRNLAIGWGLLSLLGGAIGAIIFSTQRARAFAQRQVDFVSSVSHEFRTPLAVIYSAGENLADGVTNSREQTSKYGELIKSEGRKLSTMVEQILEFAGANSGRRKFNFRSTPVADIVENALNECSPLIKEQVIELETDIDTTLPSVDCDAEALSRAIQNLIANAIKYRNGNGWLRVSARNGDGSVKISVEDRGIGVSKGDLRQIFEPFYRSKEVVDAQIHGNGLGLSIVKRVVDAHGGRVTAESEPGKGSKFTIELKVN